MKLSIIIPYYDTWDYTCDLLQKLIPQLTEEMELIIVDDGCYETSIEHGIEGWIDRQDDPEINPNYKQPQVKIIHLSPNSGGASKPRNIGLDNAKGEYITFIDSDDMVADNYIQKIMKAIERKPDIIYLSWKSKAQQVTMNIRPPKWNCAVWCRVYKKEIIGNTRFDENLRVAEDWKFNEAIKYQKSVCIKDTIYFYNNGRKGSLLNGGAK